jgi:S-adenosylmethionine/arginine decarboxylase-like enzyme
MTQKGETVLQHKHLLLNATIKTPIKESFEAIAFLEDLVDSIDMKIVQGPFASYVTAEGNRGVTATVMIETSHIAFHIWDEKEPAEMKFDLYTCGALDASAVLRKVDEKFGLIHADWMVIDREDGFKEIGHS